MIDNLCDNALDLENGILNVKNNLARGTYCQWLISAQDDDSNIILEFHNFNVRNTKGFKKWFNHVINSYLSKWFFKCYSVSYIDILKF